MIYIIVPLGTPFGGYIFIYHSVHGVFLSLETILLEPLATWEFFDSLYLKCYGIWNWNYNYTPLKIPAQFDCHAPEWAWYSQINITNSFSQNSFRFSIFVAIFSISEPDLLCGHSTPQCPKSHQFLKHWDWVHGSIYSRTLLCATQNIELTLIRNEISWFGTEKGMRRLLWFQPQIPSRFYPEATISSAHQL